MSSRFVFGEAPVRVYWELTRACDLACRHCRAEAIPWVFECSKGARPVVTTTEAPHYRRVALERLTAGGPSEESRRHALQRGFGMRDGNGIMFVSHTGDVQPSGFLPLTAGNVRTASPGEIYRSAPLFQRLRQPEGFEGRCGRCEFREICGGSRARAYAATGNPFGEDPLCAYPPRRAAASE